jgi:cytochrome c oxidase cbb3-type subunit 3
MKEHPDAPPGQNVHEYDGILEYDNMLPRWWLTTFFLCISFAGGYWIYYHTFDKGLLPSEEYAEVVAERDAKAAAEMLAAGEATDELLLALSKNQSSINQGKELFVTNCVTCHAEGGKGATGPNLTDNFVLHGAKPTDTYNTIKNGYLAKQMPAWGKQLGEGKVRAATAYVLSLRGSNVAGGKEPQGEPVSQ